MRIDKLIIILFAGSLMAACSSTSDDVEGGNSGIGKKIELSFSVPDYTLNMTNGTAASVKSITRAGTVTPGSAAEREITNLYVFLFPTNSSQVLIKYYISTAAFTGGTWDTTNNKVILNLTQAEIGMRKVYIVANCLDLKAALDGVTSESGFQTVFRQTPKPWSSDLGSPVVMSGNATHDFTSGYQLNNVPLIRAIAKVELNIILSSGFQVVPTIIGNSLAEYKYRYVGFDQNTYVVKPDFKTPVTVNSSSNIWPNTSDWTQWGSSLNSSPTSDSGAGYTLTNSKVVTLKVVTYINENDAAGSAIEINLPRADEGPLPLPEFGPELYRLPLPVNIVRNTWYKYDVTI